MNDDNRHKTADTAVTEPLPGGPGIATRRTAASRSREFLSARLATREGGIAVFRHPNSGFQSSGFGPKSR